MALREQAASVGGYDLRRGLRQLYGHRHVLALDVIHSPDNVMNHFIHSLARVLSRTARTTVTSRPPPHHLPLCRPKPRAPCRIAQYLLIALDEAGVPGSDNKTANEPG